MIEGAIGFLLGAVSVAGVGTFAGVLLRALQAAPGASTWVLCPSCEMKGTPFSEEDPVECGNCGHRFPRKEHLTTPEAPND